MKNAHEGKLFRIFIDTKVRASKEGRCKRCANNEAFKAVADYRGDKEQLETTACNCRGER